MQKFDSENRTEKCPECDTQMNYYASKKKFICPMCKYEIELEKDDN